MAILKQEEIIKEITKKLSIIKVNIEYLSSINLYDINLVAEDLYCELLNIIYDYQLINLNSITKNAAGIDLGDKENRVCYQVTSTIKSTKVKSTIKTFIDKKQYEEYDILILLMLKDKQKTYPEFDTKEKFHFDKKKHIVDNHNLIKDIQHLGINKLELIARHLGIKDEYYESLRKIESTEKIIYKQNNVHIQRKWIRTIDTSKWFFQEEINRRSVLPQNAINNHYKIVLLNDAGWGKSQEAIELTNSINQNNKKLFAFCYPLRSYSCEKIVDLIPKEYEGIPYENIVFVLDGYDEISKNKNEFIKQIESLCFLLPKVKIVITSRTNHYKLSSNHEDGLSGSIKGFEEYSLLRIQKSEIETLLIKESIEPQGFWKQIYDKELGGLIENAFFIVNIIEIYKANYTLPARIRILNEIIRMSLNIDTEKYKFTLDDEFENNIFNLLEILGYSLECIERNYITKEEYHIIVSDVEQRKLLSCCSLWRKDNDNNYSFTHNNFGEYLAARFLNNLTTDEMISIVSTQGIKKRVKKSWFNTITFTLMINQDVRLFDWIVENEPSLIKQIEDSRLTDELKINIFSSQFEYYMSRRLWIPYEVTKSISDSSMIVNSEQIRFLMDCIEKNDHYTIVHNALEILGCSNLLFGLDTVVSKVLYKMCIDENYRTDQKREALELLGKFRLISKKQFQEIVKHNDESEDQYLRTGYFYYIREASLADEMISYLLDWFDKVSFRLGRNETNLTSQFTEYENVISSLREFKNVEKFINLIVEVESRYEIDSSVVRGTISALKWIYISEKSGIELISKLYTILDSSFNNQANEVIQMIVALDINLCVFKYIIESELLSKIHSLDNLMNEDTLEYLSLWYKSDCFDKEKAQKIIYALDTNNVKYLNVVNLHKEVTGVDLSNRNKLALQRRKEEKVAKNTLLEAVFDKKIFIFILEDFIAKFDIKDCSIGGLKELKISRREHEPIHRLIHNFLYKHFHKETNIDLNILENRHWNELTLSYLYDMHRNNNDYVLNSKHLNLLKEKCSDLLDSLEEVPAIRYKNGDWSFKWTTLYLAYFNYKYNVQLPEIVKTNLLEMPYSSFGMSDGFGCLVSKQDKNLVMRQIVNNIESRKIKGEILSDHYNYCIQNGISYLIDIAKLDFIDYIDNLLVVKSVANYLIKNIGFQKFIDDYMTLLNNDVIPIVESLLIEIKPECLVDFMLLQLSQSADEKTKMHAAQYLIDHNIKQGLKYYYEWIIEHKRSYSGSNAVNSINDTLSNYSVLDGLEIMAELYSVAQDDNFDDDDFHSVSRGARTAILKMASVNEVQYKKVENVIIKMIEKYSHFETITFLNYVLEEAGEALCIGSYEIPSIDSVINDIKGILESKKKKIYSW